MSAEPSMEEILSSIKRIISEEGEGPVRGRRAGRAAPPPPPPVEEDEVLELSDPMPSQPRLEERAPVAANQPEEDEAQPFTASLEPEPVMPSPRTAPPLSPPASPAAAPEPLLSPQTAQASRSALDNLSRLMVKPEPGSDGSLEGLVREMLRPMLRDWLDANLPAMVETMVESEIARITGQSR